jgi:hypothetical protein
MYDARVRRLARYTFNALAVLSLLLCMATVVLWVRSYYKLDCLSWDHADRFGELFSSAGGFYHSITYVHHPEKPIAYHTGTPRGLYITPGVIETRHWEFGGFWWIVTARTRVRYFVAEPGWSAGVPCWFAMACFASPSVAWLLVRRLSARYPVGSCVTCGYDLRATPNRCPECGTIPGKPASISN